MWVAEGNEVVFTDESRICLQYHNDRNRVWRHLRDRALNSCVMHKHTGPALCIMDNARPHVARIVLRLFVNHQIELLSWPARSPDLSPIKNMWFMVSLRLTQIEPPDPTQNQLWQRVEASWSAVPNNTSKVSLNQCDTCGSGDVQQWRLLWLLILARITLHRSLSI
ncbi:transposable element Tcb1 transposase [Trichonephila clavipes]|nr:transposable element Tcb1 transposase [Trichonephila clavipes]